MAHAATARGGETGDIGDDRFAHLGMYEFGGLGFLRPTDFADQHYRVRFRVGLEQFEDVAERASIDRVTANADTGRDAETASLQLRGRFISERTRTAYDAD